VSSGRVSCIEKLTWGRKSQLAIEYAYRVKDQSPETWIFWIHASNAARFEQSYRQIADKVKIPGTNDPKADIVELVHGWLQNENKHKWFLILDNLDDAAFLVQAPSASLAVRKGGHNNTSSQPLLAYLPQGENGSILITTRMRDAALTLVEESDIIAVDSMDLGDATLLFQKKLRVLDDDKDIANLVSLLEFMPLAIVQAAAYIAQKAPRCSARQYIENFKRNDKEKTSLLDYEGGHLRRDWEANSSIIITWQLSFDHMRQRRQSAADLLSLMSFFDRQGIPEALIQSQYTMGDNDQSHGIKERNDSDEDDASDSENDSEFENDIIMLRHYSFISIGVDRTIFEMHGLVQLAMRKWLEKHRQLERWKQKYIGKLCEEFPNGEPENWQKCMALFPHAKGAIIQKPKEEDSIRKWSMLLYNAAWYAWRRGMIADAESLSVESMKARNKSYGQDRIETLESMGMVGLVYNLRGRWKEAEDLEVQVIETRKRVLGYEHPYTLTSISNLASTYRNQGRWKEAEDLEVQVMETRKRVLGYEHPSTLISMSNLASTYRNQGRWKEAEDLEVQVMETRKRVLGYEHPDTLLSMNNLACTWKAYGRHTDALKIMEECAQLRTRVLGANHPYTLSSFETLLGWQTENLEIGSSAEERPVYNDIAN
jgi:hypothetical protein